MKTEKEPEKEAISYRIKKEMTGIIPKIEKAVNALGAELSQHQGERASLIEIFSKNNNNDLVRLLHLLRRSVESVKEITTMGIMF